MSRVNLGQSEFGKRGESSEMSRGILFPSDLDLAVQPDPTLKIGAPIVEDLLDEDIPCTRCKGKGVEPGTEGSKPKVKCTRCHGNRVEPKPIPDKIN